MNRNIKAVVLVVAGLLGGIALGVAGQYYSEPANQPAQHASTSCLNALNQADASIRTAGDGFDVVSEVLTAASNFDVSGIETASAKMGPLSNVLSGQLDQYTAARDACRGE
jgi:hypothetical protein